jgi:hypothetical protein
MVALRIAVVLGRLEEPLALRPGADYPSAALMGSFWSQETRRRTIARIVAVVLTITLVGVSALWFGGTPPSRIVFATGQPGDVYDSFGREY